MKNKDQALKWKLCDTYFSILNAGNKNSITLEEICSKSKVSYEEARKIIPKDFVHNPFFFLKILVTKLDDEALEEFKADVFEDSISTNYDKILEGITLRFEKLLEYRPALKIFSEGLDRKAEIFFKLLQQNYSFMFNLLDIVENKQNCGLKTIKSVALNIVFIKGMEVFLKDENNNLDSTLRYLDKYLKDIEDVGFFTGIIKK